MSEVPEMAAHLATRMRFSDFHIDVADDATLSAAGSFIRLISCAEDLAR